MICHRRFPTSAPCIGRECPLWVPEVVTDDASGPHGASHLRGPSRETTLGWCADNLRREAFQPDLTE